MSSAAQQCISVDLPEPLGPMTAVNSPALEVEGDVVEGAHQRLARAVGLGQVAHARRGGAMLVGSQLWVMAPLASGQRTAPSGITRIATRLGPSNICSIRTCVRYGIGGVDFQSTLFDPDRADRADVAFAGLERQPLDPRRLGRRTPRLAARAPTRSSRRWSRDVPWRAERRQMYDRVVDVPRLVHTYGVGEALPHPVLDPGARRAVGALPARARRAVRHRRLLLLPRRPRLRRLARRHHRPRPHRRTRWSRSSPSATPAGCACARAAAATSRSVAMGHGDLVVMGGSCQRTWEHAVPKVAHAGPRVSVQFRPLERVLTPATAPQELTLRR